MAIQGILIVHPRTPWYTAKFWINFSTAVFLCFFIDVLEFLIFGWLGPGLLTMVVLITSMGIVNKLLFDQSYGDTTMQSTTSGNRELLLLD